MEKIDFTLKNKYLILFNLIDDTEKAELDEIYNNLKCLSVGSVENKNFSILVFTESCYTSIKRNKPFRDLYEILDGHYHKTVSTTFDLMKYIGDYGDIFYHVNLYELEEILLKELEGLIKRHTRPVDFEYSKNVEYLVNPTTFLQMFVDSTIKARKIQINRKNKENIDDLDSTVNIW